MTHSGALFWGILVFTLFQQRVASDLPAVGVQSRNAAAQGNTTYNKVPIYDPKTWPVTMNILTSASTLLGEDPLFSAGTYLTEFPDTQMWEGFVFWEPRYMDVFCWQNGTFDHPEGRIYLRTTSGPYGSAYIPASHVLEVDHVPLDYTKLLAYCGPLRPYGVWAGTGFENDDRSLTGCYDGPFLNSTKNDIPAIYPRVYCTVTGEAVGNDTTWYLSAHSVDGEKHKCYIPGWMHHFNPDLRPPMPGAGGICPKEDWPTPSV